MLITFCCSEYENITMFGDIAKKLLRIMGHSATVPSAFVPDDLPQALALLEAFIAKDKQQSRQSHEEEEDPLVPLSHRALPLLAMLKAAQQHEVAVLWK